jgi:hypothetical protein
MNINNAVPNNGSAPAGSPNVPAANPNPGAPAGQTLPTGGAIDKAKAYDELETRFGTQGKELGEYRQFFQNIAPLLDKLDQSPEMVQAIVDGKLDKDIAKAVLEGRVDVRDAAAVQAAHDQVKTKLGDKAYEATSPEAIAKMVEDKVDKFRKEFEEKSELGKFQEYTQKFIDNTPDFKDYADEVDKWLDEHDVTDIEVAYYAVKGQMSEAAAKKVAETATAERQKEIILNAGGGGQTAQYAADGSALVDKLISGRPNPNSFFPGA